MRGTPSTSASMFAPKVSCSWRVLVQVVEDDLRDGVALEDDDDAAGRSCRERVVAQVGDALDAAAVDQLGDLHLQVVGVDLVRQLGDDQAGAALDLLDVDDGPHGDLSRGRCGRRPRCRGCP